MHPAFWELLCIKAVDERCKVKSRFDEIERRKGSMLFINKLLRESENGSEKPTT